MYSALNDEAEPERPSHEPLKIGGVPTPWMYLAQSLFHQPRRSSRRRT